MSTSKLKGNPEIKHLAPKRGSITTRCCGKPLWKIPANEKLTHKEENCTCLPVGYLFGQWRRRLRRAKA